MAVQTATATFTGAEDTIAVTWTATSSSQAVQAGVTVTDGSGPIIPWLTSRTTSGATVNVSDRFAGTVELTIEDR